MDRQLLERLIGAGVLVVALVVIVPAILDGGGSDGDADREPDVSVTASEPRRTHTIRLDQSTQTPPVARAVTKPEVTGDTGREPARSPPPNPDKKRVAAVVSSQVKPKAPSRASLPPKVHAGVQPTNDSGPLPVKSVPAPKTGWAVQLGSFSSQHNARRLSDEVSGHGFSVFVMPLDQSGKKLYRVRVGPRDTRAQASKLAQRLAKMGYSGQVARQKPDGGG